MKREDLIALFDLVAKDGEEYLNNRFDTYNDGKKFMTDYAYKLAKKLSVKHSEMKSLVSFYENRGYLTFKQCRWAIKLDGVENAKRLKEYVLQGQHYEEMIEQERYEEQFGEQTLTNDVPMLDGMSEEQALSWGPELLITDENLRTDYHMKTANPDDRALGWEEVK